MRSFILGFAFGIWLLQMEPALPSRTLLLATIAGALCALLAASLLARVRATSRRALRLLALALAGIASGFPYAAFLAERRIADALPAHWEGLDIRITGIVSG